MASRVAGKIKLQSVDELLGVPEIAGTQEIEIERIHAFPNHPFKVLNDEKMDTLVDSIRENGILNPVIVRPDQSGNYEMISGHRRLHAAKIVGLKKVPAIVKEMSDDEAIIKMVDSNLQRSVILPSEKAFSYKMRLEAMKRQAGRPSKENASPVATNLPQGRSDEDLAKVVGEGKDNIRRYIRLTNLLPELLRLVDEAKIALRPAVELSYLSEKEQHTLYDTMCCEDCTPSHAQAIKLRQFSQEGRLNSDVILSIMQEEKPNQKEQFRIPKERISKYFPAGTPAQKIEDTIIKALELYRRRQRDQER